GRASSWRRAWAQWSARAGGPRPPRLPPPPPRRRPAGGAPAPPRPRRRRGVRLAALAQSATDQASGGRRHVPAGRCGFLRRRRGHCRYGIFMRVRFRRRDLWRKFYADRGPHLAAMIAYFALLAFVPLTFLSLSLLGLAGRADESSFLVKEIKRALPGTPIDQIVKLVHAVQDNAATLGIVGGAALLWTSLSLFSVLESAFNIVYERPNRSFLRGKGLASVLMISSLVTLFVALLAGSIGVSALHEYAPGFVSNAVAAYVLSIAVSLVGVFA